MGTTLTGRMTAGSVHFENLVARREHLGKRNFAAPIVGQERESPAMMHDEACMQTRTIECKSAFQPVASPLFSHGFRKPPEYPKMGQNRQFEAPRVGTGPSAHRPRA